MTTPVSAIVPASFPTPKSASFVNANGTAAKILFEPYPEAIATGVQPTFTGGCTLLDATVSSTDTVARSLLVWFGKILSTQGSATGSITLSAQNKLTRATTTPASWITEGWQIGDQVMIFAPYGTAQVVAGIDGVVGTVSAVTAADLTVTGTPWAAGTNVLTTGSRVINVSQLFRAAIPAGAGNSDTVPNVRLVGADNDNAWIKTEQKMGSDSVWIVGMAAAVTNAANNVVSVMPRQVARY